MHYNSPLGNEKENILISILNLPLNAEVLEIGCGNGKLLTKILSTYQAKGLGVDLNEELISLATSHAHLNTDDNSVRFLNQDIKKVEIQPNSYDLIICNGSSHAFGDGEDAYKNTLSKSYSFLKKGGLLLIGEGYWKSKPEQEYLNFIGEPIGIYNDFKGNVEQAKSNGFDILYATSSNQDEWDFFEWNHKINNTELIKKDPENVDLKNKKNRIDQWLTAYLKWGRDTMGYGFYLFIKN